MLGTVRIYNCLTLFFGRRKIVCWFCKSLKFELKFEICSKKGFHSGQIRILFKYQGHLKNSEAVANRISIIFASKRTIRNVGVLMGGAAGATTFDGSRSYLMGRATTFNSSRSS
jgi:hypothetical protein